MDFGDDQEGGSEGQQQGQQRRKRYHRHTPRQIQTLEAMFKECPHPDENQRAQLSRELGLEARQIKFWFQNRRTQMKAQHERADNCFLRAENDKIRCENIAMREALKNVICPTCGGPPVAEDYFDEQKLRMENARLKEELDRVASLTSKFLGRPFTQMPQGMPQMNVELSMGGMPMGGALNLDLDLLSGATAAASSSSQMPQFHLPAPVTEMERPAMAGMATRAMDEVIRLAQAGDHVWVKIPGGDGREALNVETYDNIFSKPGSSYRAADLRVEGTRDSALVCMTAAALVDVFMDTVSKQLGGVLPEHRVQRPHRRRPGERHQRPERVPHPDVRGAAHDDARGADPRVQLPPLLPADRPGPVGHRRRLRGHAARRPLRRAATLPPAPVGVPHRRHGQWLLQGDLGRTHGDRGEDDEQPPVPRHRAERRCVRGAPLARRAAARVRALRLPLVPRRDARRHRRSDGGRAAEHDEAVAAHGEQLLREHDGVAAPPVDAHDGRRRQRRVRARLHAPQRRPGAAQRRGAQRGHLRVAARPLRPRVRLRPRREHPQPVGRPDARQSGPGGVAHPQRREPRELHLLAARHAVEPEQHAGGAGELHGRVGVAGGVLADRHPGGERGDERGGPVGHPAAAVRVQHLARARRRAVRCGRVHQQPRGRVHRDRRVPDPGEQPAVVQAQRRVHRHRQRPHQQHRPEPQDRAQLRLGSVASSATHPSIHTSILPSELARVACETRVGLVGALNARPHSCAPPAAASQADAADSTLSQTLSLSPSIQPSIVHCIHHYHPPPQHLLHACILRIRFGSSFFFGVSIAIYRICSKLGIRLFLACVDYGVEE